MEATAAAGPAPLASPWLRGPAWDLGLIAFPWLPFALWMILGPLGTATSTGEWNRAFEIAVVTALVVNFVHRHYVFLLVYGDGEAFAARRIAYLLAPVAAVGTVGLVLWSHREPLIDALFVGVTAWNVWHVVMQRYGILRIYAKKSGGGLESAAEAKLDRAFLWALVLATACATLLFRRSTFRFYPDAEALAARVGPLVANPWIAAALSTLLLASLAVVARWLIAEVRAKPTASRWPRIFFVASILGIFATFLVAGPVIGYLTFAMAHNAEYIAFVHHFGQRKYSAPGRRPSFARLALARGFRAPLVFLSLAGLFWLVKNYRATEVYLLYYTSTGLLHFLYDGWIWKVRRPSVSAPLGIQTPA
jgi:hypothetical protein